MPNQYKNKVIYGDQTLMDITDTTASSEDVLEGEVFYSANGARSTGSLGDATTSTHGLMSAADKTKLNTIDTTLTNSYFTEGRASDSSSLIITDAENTNINKITYEINPITPISTITGTNTSKNLLIPEYVTYNYYLNTKGGITDSAGDAFTDTIQVLPGDTLYIYGIAGKDGNRRLHGYNSNKTWVQQLAFTTVTADTEYDFGTIIIPEGIYYIRYSYCLFDSNIMIEKGSKTSYEEYYSNNIITNTFTALSNATLYVSETSASTSNSDILSHSITFPSDTYGVSIEIVNGTSVTINKTWDYIASYDGETIGDEWYSTNGNDTISPSTGASVLYKLSTPVALTGYTASNILPVLYENTNYIWFVLNGTISHNIKELEYSKHSTLKYALPAATSNLLGGIKIGNGITMTNGVADVNTASSLQLGIVKIGENINIASDGTISIPKYVQQQDAVFTGSLSMGRLPYSTKGTNSVAIGTNAIASGKASVSIGDRNIVNSDNAMAIGRENIIEGSHSLSVGYSNRLYEDSYNSICAGSLNVAKSEHSVIFGHDNTINMPDGFTTGDHNTVKNYTCSIFGSHNIATGAYSLISGCYNIKDTAPKWTSETSYAVDDKVTDKYGMIYKCIQATSSEDVTNSSYWQAWSNYLVIVGNGIDDNNRSNAYTLDWNGNGRFNGNVYVGCNADSTGGSKLATELYVSNALLSAGSLPSVTSADNGKILQVSNGDWAISTLTIPMMVGATSNTAGASGLAPAPNAGDQDKFLKGDGTWAQSGLPMVVLSYGNSTWADFINAYNNNVIVYCRASSNSNPASGTQGRMAFMAYVNNSSSPTEVEFQYYRSISSHSATQMGDQVFIYKLNKTNGWSVTTREASIKRIKVDSNDPGTVSWSGNVVTLKSGLPKVSSADEGKILKVVNGVWTAVDP